MVRMQHPTVLGRERIRRERLGEVVGREDHLQLRKGCPPQWNSDLKGDTDQRSGVHGLIARNVCA